MEEGVKNKPYRDSLGYLTIGIGHLIDDRKGGYLPTCAAFELDQRGALSDATVSRIYRDDLEQKIRELNGALPWVSQLDDVRYMALLDMCFQMGIGGLLTFKNTLRHIEQGNYEQAAENMRVSKWYKQTPNRAKRRIDEIRTGIAYNYN